MKIKLLKLNKKIISFVLTVIMIIGMVPFGSIITTSAADEDNYIILQILENNKPIKNGTTCELYNEDYGFKFSGETKENGIWDTKIKLNSEFAKISYKISIFQDDKKYVSANKTDFSSASKDNKYLIVNLKKENDSVTLSTNFSSSLSYRGNLEKVNVLTKEYYIKNDSVISPESMQLPKQVEIVTNLGETIMADVEWDLSKFEIIEGVTQTLDVPYTVKLPVGVENTKDISLYYNVSVRNYESTYVSKQPESITAFANADVSFSINATNPIKFQWYHNGSKITDDENYEGATASVLNIKNINMLHSGAYYCVVTGEAGDIDTSNECTLTVKSTKPDVSISVTPEKQTRPQSVTVKTKVPENFTGDLHLFYNDSTEPFDTIHADGNDKKSEYEFEFFAIDDVNQYVFKVVCESKTGIYSDTEVESNVIDFEKGYQKEISVEVNTPAKNYYEFKTDKNAVSTIEQNLTEEYIAISDSEDENVFTINCGGGLSKDKFYFDCSNNSFITAKEQNKNTFKFTVKKTGHFSITVYKKGDNDYNDSDKVILNFYTIKNQQDDLLVVNGDTNEPLMVSQDPNYDLEINIEHKDKDTLLKLITTGGSTTSDFICEQGLASGINLPVSSYMSDDKVNLFTELGIIMPGEYVLKITKNGNSYYDKKEKLIKVVSKYYQKVGFKDTDKTDFKMYYGQSFDIRPEVLGEQGTQKPVIYSFVDEKGNNIISDVANISDDGIITIKDGVDLPENGNKLNVKAIFPEDNYCYEEVINYTVTALPYKITKKLTFSPAPNIYGWYNKKFDVVAPKDYLISFSNEQNASLWFEKLTVPATSNIVYIRNNNTQSKDYLAISEKIEPSYNFDNIKPEVLTISYSDDFKEKLKTILKNVTFGFYKAPVTVTVTAQDDNSGIESISWTYNKQDGASNSNLDTLSGVVKFDDTDNFKYSDDKKIISATFKLPKEVKNQPIDQLRGKLTIVATDKAGNSSKEMVDKENIIVVDTISPTCNVVFSKPKQVTDKNLNTVTDYKSDDASGNYNLYYKDKATLTFNITEANFYPENVKVNVFKDGKILTDNDENPITFDSDKWTKADNSDIWTNTLTLSHGDGHYIVKMSAKDYSENVMGKEDNSDKENENEIKEYTSNEIIFDSKKPIIKNIDFAKNEYFNGVAYKFETSAKIVVEEDNFRPQDFEFDVIATNSSGEIIDVSACEYDKYLQDPDEWTTDGNKHTAYIYFAVDANYSIKSFNYKDLALNNIDTYKIKDFSVDNEPPKILKIEYINDYYKKGIDTILENVTFGFYKTPVTVKVYAQDTTSGVKSINWEYNQQENTSSINLEKLSDTVNFEDLENFVYSEDKKIATVTFKLPKEVKNQPLDQLRGNLTIYAVDGSGNSSKEMVDKENIIVVDTISPTCNVTFSNPAQVTDKNLNTVTDYSTDDASEKYNLYYNGNATLTFNITEANFFEDQVNITVTKNGKPITVNLDSDKWTQNGDIWTNSLTLSGDGNYVVTMAYTDYSNNEMTTYTSNEIIIDTVNPSINVSYPTDKIKQKIGDRNYYDNEITSTITVTEDNFRAEDIKVTVVAKDVSGKNVKIEDYTENLKDRSKWVTSEDGKTHTATITYSANANYTFDVNYVDLALREIPKYSQDLFTVDNQKPEKLTINYSNNLENSLTTILENVTFGFYKAPVTVTVTAEDITAGVEYFSWEYNKQSGTSDKNLQNITGVVEYTDNEHFSYSNNGKTATATVVLPKEINKQPLDQLRGNLNIIVTDKSNNSEKKLDEKNIIVVDTISPTRTVTFSKPAQVTDKNLNTVTDYKLDDEEGNYNLYYNSDATLTFSVTEANFFEDQVIINVSKDGVTNSATLNSSKWTQNEDTWTNSLTLSGDGHYFVTMSYTDLSGNVMEKYTSNEIIIDTKKPVIKSIELSKENYVQNIDIDNKDYYGGNTTAKITVNEHNFRAEDFDITVVAKDVTGKNIDLSGYDYVSQLHNRDNWTTNGDTHTAEITFETDAIYSVEVQLQDLATNKISPNSYVVSDFVVDTVAPNENNFVISYSDNLKNKLDTILENVTFGFYQAPVTVTVTAEDITAGVEYFSWEYNKQSGTSDKNLQNITGVVEYTDNEHFSYSNNGKTATATFVLPKEINKQPLDQLRGNLNIIVTDKSNNSEQKLDEKNIIVVDTISPTRTVTFSKPAQVTDKNLNTVTDYKLDDEEGNYNLYYNSDATLTFNITEANFFEDQVIINVSKDGVTNSATLNSSKWTQNEDTWTNSLTLSGDGDYVVTMSYKDYSNNEMKTYTSNEIIIDTIKPVIGSIELSKENYVQNIDIDNKDYYGGNTTAKITVNEHNFRAEDFDITVVAKDITGKNIDLGGYDYVSQLHNRDNWTTNGDTHTAEITFETDAIYSVEVQLQDLATNKISPNPYVVSDFVVDTVAPNENDFVISYSDNFKNKLDTILENVTFGFYQAPVTVTVIAKDDISGVKSFDWQYKQQDNTSNVNLNELSGIVNFTDKDNFTYSDDHKTATATFVLPKEINKQPLDQLRGNLTIIATDKSENSSNPKKDTENIIVVDNISPTRTVTFSKPAQVTDKNLNTVTDYKLDDEEGNYNLYYNSDATLTFNITEANFFEDQVIINVSKDGVTNSATLNSSKWTQNEDTWTNSLTLSGDGDYVVTMSYKDYSNNEMKTYTSNAIIIDTKKPVIKSIELSKENYVQYISDDKKDYYSGKTTATITVDEHNFRAEDFDITVVAKDITGNIINLSKEDYVGQLHTDSKWKTKGDIHTATIVFEKDAIYSVKATLKDLATNTISPDPFVVSDFVVDTVAPDDKNLEISYSNNFINQILDTITFGFYQAPITVTVKTDDNTSGVEYFSWEYNKQSGTSNENLQNITGVVKYTDNEHFSYSNNGKTATAIFTLPKDIQKQPLDQIRGNVTVVATDKSDNSSDKKLDNQNIVVVDTISPTRTVTFSKPAQVTDKNLYTVTNYSQTDASGNYKLFYNENATLTFNITEANFYSNYVNIEVSKNGLSSSAKLNSSQWTKIDDTFTNSLTLSGDGHYFVTMSYTDLSGNVMEKYTSNEIIIDTVNPSINVSYPTNVVRNINNRDYYSNNVTSTITVIEHNFRAEDIKVDIISKDISNNDVAIQNYSSYLTNRNNWTTNGDTHTATITYSTDANYSFDIDYTDLATRNAPNYSPKLFTVDKVAPENLTISYSNSVLNRVINAVTFGYYNAPVTVTISATDNISGINNFVYSYKNAQNVSSVNAERTNQNIAVSENNSARVTTTFTIPQNALTQNSQFRGSVDFTAYDKSDNHTDLADKEVLVVDNITPTATVTYNNPISTVGNNIYYDGQITGTVRVNEANFYSEDFVLNIDNNKYNLNNWTHSGDVWQSSFTINNDGSHRVTATYTDRSSNRMSNYTSNNLIIDTKKPTVVVNGIKNKSANKNDIISFSITANDDNFDTSKFVPELTKIVYENGKFVSKPVDMGNIETSVQGKTYSYAIANLVDDAYYTLKCTVTDLSGNSTNTFTESGTELTEMNFSVNRGGSVFTVDNYTKDISDKYYIQQVDDDIVLTEINVDPLKSYSVKVNNKKLTENTDYTVEHSSTNGEWNKYVFKIKASNFADEGEYNVVITSTDKTDTTAYSDIKSVDVSFVVDKTAPEVTVSGIAQNGRYRNSAEQVIVIPYDDGGMIEAIKITVSDADGNITSTPVDLSGEKLISELEKNSSKLEFVVYEGLHQNVDITCEDKSGNVYISGEKYHNITVSPNAFVIFWANNLSRWLVIGGIILVFALIFIIVVAKKKKKNKK